MSHNNPKLRWPIEAKLQLFEGQEVLVLSCPMGIVEQPLVLIPAVAPIISCFDGSQSIDQIVSRFSQHGVNRELVNEIVTLLDNNCFLATPRFDQAHRNIVEAFAASASRPAALAGLGYPAAGTELQGLVSTILAQERLSSVITDLGDVSPIGIVSPHIDYRRGAKGYSEAYSILKSKDSQTVLLIGTSHQFSRGLFHLCAKDFETPLGSLRCATDIIDEIANKYGRERSFSEQIVHKREHSLELQTPFLKFLSPNIEIVPVLVGSFHHMLTGGRMPEEYDEYERFLEATAATLKERTSDLLVIAGVDMAHVGRYFGDSGQLTPEFMELIGSRDQLYLSAIQQRSKRAIFEHVAEDCDGRRICGFPTMYAVTDLLERLGITYKTRRFGYHQAIDYPSDCAVTFAALGMFLEGQK